ncbi:restriction endonuclease subunit S [Bilifractor sp. LCP19S3_H10]|uniref:restriction endonuclease subunit S n=1 Tax=Bilifractor sp. LCP19S3_H10 TaxID=3438736 RepID=UPI003F9206D1
MEYIALKDVCKINMGQSPKSSSYNENGEGIPFFQGNADFGERYPVTRVWCNAPTKIANAGDILISVRAPIGALNYAKEECCIGRGLAAITPDPGKFSTEFIFWLLRGKNAELNSKGTGSTFKAIGRKVLEETLVPDYGFKQQHICAENLEKVYAIIQMRKQELLKLDELIKARFVEMFGDIIRNNKGWPQYVFSDIATSRLGKMLDAKQQTGKYKYPYLANFNVQWFRFELENLNEMDFNEADQVEFQLKDGDLLVCEGGEIGRCAVWHNEIQPCYFQKALHRVRCNTDMVLPDYLARWFQYNCEHGGFASIEGAKATIAHLPGAKLKLLKVTVPPIELQERFVTFVAQVDKSKVA